MGDKILSRNIANQVQIIAITETYESIITHKPENRGDDDESIHGPAKGPIKQMYTINNLSFIFPFRRENFLQNTDIQIPLMQHMKQLLTCTIK